MTGDPKISSKCALLSDISAACSRFGMRDSTGWFTVWEPISTNPPSASLNDLWPGQGPMRGSRARSQPSPCQQVIQLLLSLLDAQGEQEIEQRSVKVMAGGGIILCETLQLRCFSYVRRS